MKNLVIICVLIAMRRKGGQRKSMIVDGRTRNGREEKLGRRSRRKRRRR